MISVKPRGKADAKYVIVGDCPKQDEFTNGLAFDEQAFNLLVDLLEECEVNYEDVMFVNCSQFMKRSGKVTAEELKTDASENLIPLINAYPRELVLVMGNNALCASGVTKKPEKINSLKGQIVTSDLLTTTKTIVPIIHPYSVLKEPDLVDEFIQTTNFAFRVAQNPEKLSDQVPIEIYDIETLEDVDLLIDMASESKMVAYDFETTGTGPEDYPISCAFATGHTNEKGEYLVFFWASHDKMRPLFDDDTYQKFIDKLTVFFRLTGVSYARIAWNKSFDDPMAERLTKCELPPSDFDAMIEKWSVNSRRPHDLKTNTAKYLGYANYDREVDEKVREVAERRGKLLTNEEDFMVLKMFGHEPIKTAKGYKWTKNVDKKLCAWAMIDFETLRRYNAYDAIYTLLLHLKFKKVIKKEKLANSCEFRHRISYRLVGAEQRGLQLDVKTNRAFSKELKKISENCQKQIIKELAEMGYDLPDFNAGSGDQLAEILYGKPTSIPAIDVDHLVDKKGWDPAVADDKCGALMDEFYDDGKWLKPQLTAKIPTYDYDDVARRLSAAFEKKFGFVPHITPTNVYILGRHEPQAFTKTGKPSTAGAILTSLYQQNQEPFLSMVLLKRKVDKLKSTFIDAVYDKRDKNDVVHPRYNVIGTDSGRISSSNPNGQNLSPFVRGQFIPRKGYRFLQFDLSQAEVRAVAAFSDDEALMSAFMDGDIHSNIASIIFKCDPKDVTKEQRRFTKTVVFGIIYGRGAFALSVALGCTKQEAQEFIDKFFSTFPKLKQWLDNQKKIARKKPYYVYTPWGTRRSTRNILSTDKAEVAHIERISQNMPIQGAAGELTLWYICEMMDAFEDAGYDDVHLVNTTHDSVVFEVPEDLVWKENIRMDGEKEKYDIGGPIYKIVKEILDAPVPIEPLNKVKFAADCELNDFWEGAPDLLRAIDPEKGGEKSLFRWDIIKAEEVLDKDELEEWEDVVNANS
jgi:uracil-DNA glycosylase family 4